MMQKRIFCFFVFVVSNKLVKVTRKLLLLNKGHWEIDHEAIQRKYAAAGYDMPEIVYWNLRASSRGSKPVAQHASGVAMLCR